MYMQLYAQEYYDTCCTRRLLHLSCKFISGPDIILPLLAVMFHVDMIPHVVYLVQYQQ